MTSSAPYYLPPYSLHATGLLLTEMGRIPFKVIYGTACGLSNYQHEEDDYGTSLELDVCKHDPKKVALELVERTLNDQKIAGTLEVVGGDRKPGLYFGSYLLIGRRNLTLDPVEKRIILFVSHKGRTFQHFASNILATDDEVEKAFALLKDERATRAAA